MGWLLLLVACVSAQTPFTGTIDVSRLTVGAAEPVATVDMGRLKGEPRQLGWAPDQATLYLQTAEGNPPIENLRHYTIALNGGAITPIDEVPGWAVEYWNLKQDRVAPGVPSLSIEAGQKRETLKVGTGPTGALDRSSDPMNSAGTISATDGNAEKANVITLTLLGEEIARWVNERVIPGMRFGWAPTGSAALVYVAEGGRLVLFDRQKHRQTIKDVKDALLPAWSPAGDRLAYLRKTGRKTYVLECVPVAR
jgi:hypothetical protein